MRKYFKGSTDMASDWMLADSGNSQLDNNDWYITTNSLHADQVPEACKDAKTFSQLVSGLLNAYYNGVETISSLSVEALIEMGTVEESEAIPNPANPTLF